MLDREKTIETAREYMQKEAAALSVASQQIDDSFLDVVEMLRSLDGKVVVTGAGTSGTIARRLAHLLNVTGTSAFYLSPVDGLHGSLGSIGDKDVVIAISKGGESEELTELVKRARERGAATIALTSVAKTPLEAAVDQVAVVDSPGADLGGVIATGSSLAHASWGDALCMTLMNLKEYGWDRVLHSHPGGAVGLKDLSDIP